MNVSHYESCLNQSLLLLLLLLFFSFPLALAFLSLLLVLSFSLSLSFFFLEEDEVLGMAPREDEAKLEDLGLSSLPGGSPPEMGDGHIAKKPKQSHCRKDTLAKKMGDVTLPKNSYRGCHIAEK